MSRKIISCATPMTARIHHLLAWCGLAGMFCMILTGSFRWRSPSQIPGRSGYLDESVLLGQAGHLVHLLSCDDAGGVAVSQAGQSQHDRLRGAGMQPPRT